MGWHVEGGATGAGEGREQRAAQKQTLSEVPPLLKWKCYFGRQCGNCGGYNHRCEGCPDPCFACGLDHSYLYCPSVAARDRAAKNRAQWYGGRPRKEPLAGKKVRDGKEWRRQSWDPEFDPPTPGKSKRTKYKKGEDICFDGVTLRSLLQAEKEDLCNEMTSCHYLSKPGTCNACGKEPVYTDGRWECPCREIRHTVFKDSVFCAGEGNERVRLDIHEAASFVWCFAHEVNYTTTAAITGIPVRTVKAWLARFREKVRVNEKAYQDDIRFTSEGSRNGFCHVQGDATRVKKSHRRDQDNAIQSTDHCSALVLKQQNSLKAVVVAVPTQSVSVGADGKPGAVPPERDELVYTMVV